MGDSVLRSKPVGRMLAEHECLGSTPAPYSHVVVHACNPSDAEGR